jgi:cell division protease FtsH
LPNPTLTKQTVLAIYFNMKPNNDKNNLNRKVIINLAYLFSIIILIVVTVLFSQNLEQQTKPKATYTDLVSLVRDNKVSEIKLSENKESLKVKVYNSDERNRNDVTENIYPTISQDKSKTVLENLQVSLGDKKLEIGNNENQIIYSEEPKSWYNQLAESGLFQNLLFIAVILGGGAYLLKRVGDANNRTISFGNTKAKQYDEEGANKITFADVAGNEEAKQELNEVVDFLKRPEEYLKMGAKIPKGVLLVGTPGNGKTLMAKAIAGEAGVPFLFVSGSEFVEMFVGVGAGRVRDLFKKAKKKAPCVIFIDEIDAVGRQRGAGMGGGNDEREQTLNQILVELDGFEPTSAVIVIGATNRPDVLDPALLRPGRFDRQVTVTSPDRKEREQILALHARNKKLAKDADLSIVAKRTAGFSGADLFNVLNEAAILTVREKKPEIDNIILREAVEKVLLGPSLKSKVITDEQKKLTAYHEAGHALVATVLPRSRKVQKVTIIPRGRAAGYTFSDDGDNDPITRSKSEFIADIAHLFGGYCAEEIMFGETSTGASSDLSKATEIARNMVTRYGMSEGIGPVVFQEEKTGNFLGKEVEQKLYSQDAARIIDQEVSKIVLEGYRVCRSILIQFQDKLKAIADALVEKEVLEFEDFNELTSDVLNVEFKLLPLPESRTKTLLGKN